jgi:hypothetical protein
MRRIVPLLLLGCLWLLPACDRDVVSSPTAPISGPVPTTSPSGTTGATGATTETGATGPTPASPDPSPSATPTLDLPPDAPTLADGALDADALAAEAYAPLVPPGSTVTSSATLAVPTDPIDQIALTWRRGADPFAPQTGLVVWQRPGAEQDWRAVYAFTTRPASGVLGTSVEAGDLTRDGIEDLLTLEQRGGSGACGTWRVVESRPGAPRETFRLTACDTEVTIAGGDLEVREAVFDADDPHCCPSAVRTTTLRWNGQRWERTSRTTEPAPGA